MMQPRKVDDDQTVSSAIVVDDVVAIRDAGFKSIICNRYDGEDPGQTSFAAIERAAADQGLKAVWQPVTGMVVDASGQEFAQYLDALPKPVFAYCRAGVRCVLLWSLAKAGKTSTAEIVAKAANAGFDISGLAPRLEAIAEQDIG